MIRSKQQATHLSDLTKLEKFLKILKSERPFYEKCENQDTMDASVFGQSKINKGKIDQLTISWLMSADSMILKDYGVNTCGFCTWHLIGYSDVDERSIGQIVDPDNKTPNFNSFDQL